MWIRWERRGACSFLIRWRVFWWRWKTGYDWRWGGGGQLLQERRARGRGRMNGELITHIISPQIDAASRHNWRFSRSCERMSQFPSSSRYVCACVRRAWETEGGKIMRTRCLNGFCCRLKIRRCLFILYIVAVNAAVEPVAHHHQIWILPHEPRISQMSLLVPFCVNDLWHILASPF